MFLLGKSFKETLCRRNVKTSVIRSWRKCWKTGGRFLFCLSKKPHVILCLGCHRAYPSWVLDSLSWPCLSPGVSRNTPVTPSFPCKVDWSSCESRNGGIQSWTTAGLRTRWEAFSEAFCFMRGLDGWWRKQDGVCFVGPRAAFWKTLVWQGNARNSADAKGGSTGMWQEIYTKTLSSRQTVKQEWIRRALDSLTPGVSSQPKTIDNKNTTYVLGT